MKSIPWTEKEIEILKANFPHENSVDVAAMIGRTTFAISHKAKRLGIKKSEAFSKSVKSGKYLKKAAQPIESKPEIEIICHKCQFKDYFLNMHPCNTCIHMYPTTGTNQFLDIESNSTAIPQPEKVIPQKSILKSISNFFKRSAV